MTSSDLKNYLAEAVPLGLNLDGLFVQGCIINGVVHVPDTFNDCEALTDDYPLHQLLLVDVQDVLCDACCQRNLTLGRLTGYGGASALLAHARFLHTHELGKDLDSHNNSYQALQGSIRSLENYATARRIPNQTNEEWARALTKKATEKFEEYKVQLKQDNWALLREAAAEFLIPPVELASSLNSQLETLQSSLTAARKRLSESPLRGAIHLHGGLYYDENDPEENPLNRISEGALWLHDLVQEVAGQNDNSTAILPAVIIEVIITFLDVEVLFFDEDITSQEEDTFLKLFDPGADSELNTLAKAFKAALAL